ncbi:MAG: hypothetical protein RL338_325 [Chloroflexota bacterium]
MPTRIDHLVIAVADPDGAAALLERELGLRATGGGDHARLGTFNRLVWLGDTYLELIGVRDPTLAAASWVGAPTVRTLAAGGGLATWAVATERLDVEVDRLRAGGADLAGPLDGERTRPDGRVVRWRLAAASRLGPLEPPFLIEHDGAAAEWTPAERAARAAEAHPIGGPVRLERLELPVAETHRIGMRLLVGAGIGPFRPSLAGRGARDAAIGAATLRLVPTRPPGDPPVATVVLRVAGTPAGELRCAELLGCRWLVLGGGR